MSDAPDSRASDGTAADRKTSAKDVTAYGALLSLITGAADWLLIECYATGHFHWIAPSQELIAMAVPIVFLPVVLWIARVFSLIGAIITNRLQKDAAQ